LVDIFDMNKIYQKQRLYEKSTINCPQNNMDLRL